MITGVASKNKQTVTMLIVVFPEGANVAISIPAIPLSKENINRVKVIR